MDQNFNQENQTFEATQNVATHFEAATQPIQEFQPIILEKPKKSKKPLIIALIVVVILGLITGGIALFLILKPRDFSYILDKTLACEASAENVSISLDNKFTKENKLEMNVKFLGEIKVKADYKIISQDGKIAKIEISNTKTQALGQTQENDQKSIIIVNLENLKDDKIKITSESTENSITSQSMECKIKKEA